VPTQTTDLSLLEDLEDVGRTSEVAESDLDALHAVAADVQAVESPNVGHFGAEETPHEILTALIAFLAAYRDGALAAHDRQEPRLRMSSRIGANRTRAALDLVEAPALVAGSPSKPAAAQRWTHLRCKQAKEEAS